jgi:hypothetical protein
MMHFFVPHGLLALFLYGIGPLTAICLLALLTLKLVDAGGYSQLLAFVGRPASWATLAALCSGLYLTVLALASAYPGFLDTVEPNIASVSWMVWRGAPNYHSLLAPQRYSLIYGPGCDLTYALALGLFGPSIATLKAAVIVANLLLVFLLWLIYSRELSKAGAFFLTTVVVCCAMLKSEYLFMARGDILLLCAAALGLYGALQKRTLVAVAAFALGLGYATAIKASAPLYFVVPGMLLFRRKGPLATVAGTFAGLAFSAFPFLLPNVSLRHYLEWIHQASMHPYSSKELVLNLCFVVFMLLPCALLLARFRRTSSKATADYLRSRRPEIVALLATVVAVCLLSSKYGAGRHHLLPFYGLIGYVSARLYREANEAAEEQPMQPMRPMSFAAVAGWIAVSCAVVVGSVSTFAQIWRLDRQAKGARAIQADLRAIMTAYPDRIIEMGPSDPDPWTPAPSLLAMPATITNMRALLVFAGNPLTLDASAMADMQLAGMPIPSVTRDYMEDCATPVWLFPRGTSPFLSENIYSFTYPIDYPGRYLFDRPFRDAFLLKYVHSASTQYFDVWTCRAEASIFPPLAARLQMSGRYPRGGQ